MMMASPKISPTNLPPRNPIPLSAAQEAAVAELYHKRVRAKCADEIREFAACATNRTFSAIWHCRPLRLAMNSCMIQYATQEEKDAAREEWFATREQRALERKAKEEKRKEQEAFNNEWWSKPEAGSK